MRFKVVGKTAFPFDMLRYDECYPASSADSVALTQVRGKMRVIELETHKQFTTDARWESFGWEVM